VAGFASSGLPGPKGNLETFVWLADAGREPEAGREPVAGREPEAGREPVADLERAVAEVEP
jgi:23S rRNA (cytidine1920-2'-O)/16S rRNA (cytidine1409-2'-O)-methyltransferase